MIFFQRKNKIKYFLSALFFTTFSVNAAEHDAAKCTSVIDGADGKKIYLVDLYKTDRVDITDGIPVLKIFDDGWLTEEGKNRKIYKTSQEIKLKKQIAVDDLAKLGLADYEHTQSLKGISFTKEEDGGFKFLSSDDPTKFFLANTVFERAQEFQDIQQKTSKLSFVRQWLEGQSQFPAKLSQFHNISLIDNERQSSSVIPRITHTIISKLDSRPSLPYLRRMIKVLPTEQGWKHKIWLLNHDQQSNFIPSDLASNITIEYVSDLSFSSEPTRNVFFDNVEKIGQLGYYQLSCFLRYAIIARFGGWHIAPDVELIETLDRFSKPKFVGFIDQTIAPCLSNSFFGAAPAHPMLIKAVQLINQNKVNWSNDFGLGKLSPYILFGACVFSKAFDECSNPSTDLLLASSSFKTMFKNSGFLSVTDDDFKLEAGQIAVHFTQGEWRQ